MSPTLLQIQTYLASAQQQVDVRSLLSRGQTTLQDAKQSVAAHYAVASSTIPSTLRERTAAIRARLTVVVESIRSQTVSLPDRQAIRSSSLAALYTLAILGLRMVQVVVQIVAQGVLVLVKFVLQTRLGREIFTRGKGLYEKNSENKYVVLATDYTTRTIAAVQKNKYVVLATDYATRAITAVQKAASTTQSTSQIPPVTEPAAAAAPEVEMQPLQPITPNTAETQSSVVQTGSKKKSKLGSNFIA